MSLTNQGAIDLYQVVMKLKNNDSLPARFSWALMRTGKKLKELIDSLTELQTPHAKQSDFETKRIVLCTEAADKGEDGKPLVENGNFVLSDEAKKTLDVSMKELREGEFKDMFEDIEKKKGEIKQLLNDPYEGDLYKVEISALPEAISPADLEVLEPMLIEVT